MLITTKEGTKRKEIMMRGAGGIAWGSERRNWKEKVINSSLYFIFTNLLYNTFMMK